MAIGKISPKFGEIYINRFASELNPHRVGIAVKTTKVRGSDLVMFTNGEGDFWETYNGDNSNFERAGQIDLAPLAEAQDKGE